VSGEIPQDVIEEAKENAGFKYAELESKENPHQEQEYYENEKSVENTNIPSTTKGNYKESIIKIVAIRVNNFLKQHNPMNIFKKKHNRKLHPTPT
jgi:signal recognition particle subunit SEC65